MSITLLRRLCHQGFYLIRDANQDITGSGRAWELRSNDGNFICLLWENDLI